MLLASDPFFSLCLAYTKREKGKKKMEIFRSSNSNAETKFGILMTRYSQNNKQEKQNFNKK